MTELMALAQDEAARIRSLHNVPGVVVIVLGQGQSPMGIAVSPGNEEAVIAGLPIVLREIADIVEKRAITFEKRPDSLS
jgi:hypothetical protein